MTMSDPLGDMLTRIRNGQNAGLDVVHALASRLHMNVLEVLKQEGYIRYYNCVEVRTGVKMLEIGLKYHDSVPVIRKIERVSKPGRRVYSKISHLKKVYGGLGVSVLSTPSGVMSDNEARQKNVGGEVLCRLF